MIKIKVTLTQDQRSQTWRCLRSLNASCCFYVLGPSPFQDPEVIKFLEDFQKLALTEALQGGTDRSNKVIDFQLPQELEVTGRFCLLFYTSTRSKRLLHLHKIVEVLCFYKSLSVCVCLCVCVSVC